MVALGEQAWHCSVAASVLVEVQTTRSGTVSAHVVPVINVAAAALATRAVLVFP